jgi:uncharacterized protein
MRDPLIVWQLSDGKRGHERQCEGLLRALAERRRLELHRLGVARGFVDRCRAKLMVPGGGSADLPPPDLLIGAGRACQWPLFVARRRHGGRSIYLMRPALPLHCFDLCVIPRHDGVSAGARVEISEGPLNPMRPTPGPRAPLGLVLIGGPSRHHRYDDEQILLQIRQLVARAPELDWTVSDSRRTPPALAAALADLDGCHYLAHRDTPPDWLPATLAVAAQAWVSADSIAMLYETLSAGAALGVIEVPARRADRVSGVAGELRARGWAVTLNDLIKGQIPAARVILNEAGRIADLVLARWSRPAA